MPCRTAYLSWSLSAFEWQQQYLYQHYQHPYWQYQHPYWQYQYTIGSISTLISIISTLISIFSTRQHYQRGQKQYYHRCLLYVVLYRGLYEWRVFHVAVRLMPQQAALEKMLPVFDGFLAEYPLCYG
jgi:hypothetical protein